MFRLFVLIVEFAEGDLVSRLSSGSSNQTQPPPRPSLWQPWENQPTSAGTRPPCSSDFGDLWYSCQILRETLGKKVLELMGIIPCWDYRGQIQKATKINALPNALDEILAAGLPSKPKRAMCSCGQWSPQVVEQVPGWSGQCHGGDHPCPMPIWYPIISWMKWNTFSIWKLTVALKHLFQDIEPWRLVPGAI